MPSFAGHVSNEAPSDVWAEALKPENTSAVILLPPEGTRGFTYKSVASWTTSHPFPLTASGDMLEAAQLEKGKQ